MTMQVYQAILWLGLIQGIVLGTGLAIRHWRSKSLNPFPLILLGILSLALLGKVLYDPVHFFAHPSFWYVFDTLPYLIGPLWYLALRQSREHKVKWTVWDTLLMAPILYHLGFQAWLLTASQAEWIAYLSGNGVKIGWILFPLTIILVNSAFWMRGHFFILKTRSIPFPRPMITGQWIFAGVLGLWLLCYGFSFLADNGVSLNLIAYEISFLCLALLTQGLVMLGMVKPQSFVFLSQRIDQEEEERLRALAEQVEKHLTGAKAYLINGYTLKQLAADIQSNPVLTSKAINRVLKMNFSELVNGYRVEYFLQLAQQGEARNYTHWALAQQAGFGNKVTFYKSFKQAMGETPKSYLSGLELSKSS